MHYVQKQLQEIYFQFYKTFLCAKSHLIQKSSITSIHNNKLPSFHVLDQSSKGTAANNFVFERCKAEADKFDPEENPTLHGGRMKCSCLWNQKLAILGDSAEAWRLVTRDANVFVSEHFHLPYVAQHIQHQIF